MTINTSISNHTIICPVCGAAAHGLVTKGSGIAELVGCDVCRTDLMEHISRHPNIDGNGYEYYAAERTPTDPDDYSLSTPYDAVSAHGGGLDMCPICGRHCDTIILDEYGSPIGCDACFDDDWIIDPDYDDLEWMYNNGYGARCKCDAETYNRWAIAKAREEQIVTGKAGRPLISGWDKDGQGNLYDI